VAEHSDVGDREAGARSQEIGSRSELDGAAGLHRVEGGLDTFARSVSVSPVGEETWTVSAVGAWLNPSVAPIMSVRHAAMST
jgi:hypothetical protein